MRSGKTFQVSRGNAALPFTFLCNPFDLILVLLVLDVLAIRAELAIRA